MMEIKDEIVKLLDDKQVSDISVINFKNNSPFLDYFIIGTCLNGRMAKAMLTYVEDLCASLDVECKISENNADSKWFLIDCGSVVVHLFYDCEREKYDLEGLWKDLIEK